MQYETDSLPSVRHVARLLLGTILVFAGLTHLTVARTEFRAQVPDWVPMSVDAVVLWSGVAEIAIGIGLVFLANHRRFMGIVAALFFAAIFPGNLHQYQAGISAFGLNSDGLRLMRLFFQPILVLWPLWATGIWPKVKNQ